MATNFYSLPLSLCPFLALSFLLHLLLLTPTKTEAGGFTADLIHRDSPQSPFYDPKITEADRVANAIRRSFSRVARFARRPNYDIQSPLFPSGFEYLMNLSIGEPPSKTTLLVDTSSNLTWKKCRPCARCSKKNFASFFYPKKSSTYKELPCTSKPCRDVVPHSTCTKGTVCQYTSVDVARDTFTFGSSLGKPVSVPKIVFGCRYDNLGSTDAANTGGVIGLDGGSLSLAWQLGGSNRKFSYCLAPDPKHTSKISFGNKAVVSGKGVVSTPFVFKSNSYCLTLESVTVGNKKLGYETKMPFEKTSGGSVGEEGNIVINLGIFLTRLPSEIFRKLESQLSKVIKGKPFELKYEGVVFKLCYRDVNFDNYPALTFKFKGKGAEVELPAQTAFIVNGKYLCLAMVPIDGVGVFGNRPQRNFLIGYDLVKKKISFKPTNCTLV